MEDSSDLVLQVKTKFFWANGLVHSYSQEKKGTHLPKQEHLILILLLLT